MRDAVELAGPLGTPLGLAQWKRASSRGETGNLGFLSFSDSNHRVPLLASNAPDLTRIAESLQSWDRRVRPRLVWRNGTPLDSRVVHGVTGHLSICMWNLQVFLDDAPGCHCPFVLCLHPQGCLQRGFRASGSFQERTGKLGSFSMWYHPRGYVSNFLGRPASS